MKKSVEILGLPVISITEGRELGLSKTLLIDAKNGLVAAITIEDDDWYRGVKLIPYESVIAIGTDAVTITHSENILKLEDAGDYEALLDENIRVIGTKAITKNGMIQGTVTEIFVGDDGRIERCEITAPDGTASEVTAEQISIFGKQVTVIESELEKKTELIIDLDEEPEHYSESTDADSFYDAGNETAVEPAVEEPFAPEPEPAADSFSQNESIVPELIEEHEPEPSELESVMTPEPAIEEPVATVEEPAPMIEEPTPAEEPVEELPAVEEPVEEIPTVEEAAPIVEEPEPIAEEPVEELPAVEEVDTSFIDTATIPDVPAIEELPTAEQPVEELPTVEAPVEEAAPMIEEPTPAEEVAQPVEELSTVEAPVEEVAPMIEEPVEEMPTVEQTVEEISTVEAPVEEAAPTIEEPTPVEEPVEEMPAVEQTVEEMPTVEAPAPVVEPTPAPTVSELVGNAPAFEQPSVEENIVAPVAELTPNTRVEAPATAPVEVQPVATPVEETNREEVLEQRTRHKTQQAEILRAALRKAMAKQAKIKSGASTESATVADRLQSRRSMFLGKHATATIKTDNGIAIVEEGAEITEAVFQKARLANKLTELSKNIQ